jgi:hypothetical protein
MSKPLYDRNSMTDEQVALYYESRIADTKAFGHTYVHTGMRGGITFNGIRYHVGGFGRSLQTAKGHKYKVSKHLEEVAAA